MNLHPDDVLRLLAILAFFAGAVALLGLVINAFMRENHSKLHPTSKGPKVCGHCGYAAAGLQSFVCPECGSDLREVGIIDPRSARSMSLLSKLALWTLLCVFTGPTLVQIAERLVSSRSAVSSILAIATLVAWITGVIIVCRRTR